MNFKRFPLLFRYPGGKHYAMDILRPFWETVVHTEYREPFVGGGTVFFNKPSAKISWLNDIDSELIYTYRAVANPVSRESLLRKFATEDANPERWREILNFVPKNEIDVAFKYFYLNRTSFSGKLISAAWGYRPKRSLPPERWHERIIPCGEKLTGIKLTTKDFQEVIDKPSKNQVLMYVDPPYFLPPKKKHYRYGLDHNDHVRLANALKVTKHSFFLTYDNAEEVRSLYDWAFIYPLKFFYRIENSATQNGSRRQGFELVITNYEVPGIEHI
ncbi:DNA adenine methylase [Candidatus Dojkabacteria bacterium]|nr:DNA adenine methylase [Candidatus Dojkabacteria bacterium]